MTETIESIESRGPLIYDEESIDQWRKDREKLKRKYSHEAYSYFFISFLLISIWTVLFIMSLSVESLKALILFLLISIPITHFGIKCIKQRDRIGFVRVFERGIELPDASEKTGEFIFLPFDDIEMLYTNNKKPEKYVVFKLRDGKTVFMYKSSVYNLDKLFSILSERITVIDDDFRP